jgi:hypothetical protein
LLGETDRPDSVGSLAGAAKVEADDDRARVARKKEELVDSFIVKSRLRPLADAREYKR